MKRSPRLAPAFAFSVCAFGCQPGPATPSSVPSTAPEPTVPAPDSAAGVADAGLSELLREHWEFHLEDNPGVATGLGDHRYDRRLPDLSAAAEARRAARFRAFADRAAAVRAKGLSPADETTAELFELRMRNAIADEVCASRLWNVSAQSNPIASLGGMFRNHPIGSGGDYDNLLARAAAVPTYVDDMIANLREGHRRRWVATAEGLRRVVALADGALAAETGAWPWVERGERLGREHGRGEAQLRAVAEAEVRPAFIRFRDFVRDELLPAGRPADASGLSSLPIGKACYEARVRRYTTLPTTAKERHQQGLAEIERIDAEFEALGKKTFGLKALPKILDRLRNDPALRFKSSEEVEQQARDALAAAKAAMPKFFGRLPQADCVVKPVPALTAPFTTIAYYNGPHVDGSKPGEYFVNSYAPQTRPRFEARVLAVHEAIPGHHLQIAIAQELPDMPAFRRHGGYTAFVEGWALYTERLAEDMGLYRDDLDRFGMLSFDAWRAARLVVDTGIHAFGWSPDQAKAFLREHTALAEENIDNEVDRYIAWPGQALAYKTGQMEIWALRHKAEAALGDDFDVRAFHDAVLGGGAVTLPVLRRRIDAFIAAGGRTP